MIEIERIAVVIIGLLAGYGIFRIYKDITVWYKRRKEHA